jgi:hypothetical protein
MLDCSSSKVQVWEFFNFSFAQDVALQSLEGASLRIFQFQFWSGCCIAVPWRCKFEKFSISGLLRMLHCSSLKVQVWEFFNFRFAQDVALQFLEGASLRIFQFQVCSGCCISKWASGYCLSHFPRSGKHLSALRKRLSVTVFPPTNVK